MLLSKGELHRLVDFLPADEIAGEVGVKLDMLGDLFAAARPEGEDMSSFEHRGGLVPAVRLLTPRSIGIGVGSGVLVAVGASRGSVGRPVRACSA